MPWQWSPCAWVTITPSSRPTSAASSCWRRSGPQSTRRRSPALSTRIEERSRALRGSCGIAAAPVVADLRHAGRRAAAEDPKLHARRLAEELEEIGRGWVGELLRGLLPSARRRRQRCRRRMPARISDRGAGPARGMASPSRPASGPRAATSRFPADPARS